MDTRYLTVCLAPEIGEDQSPKHIGVVTCEIASTNLCVHGRHSHVHKDVASPLLSFFHAGKVHSNISNFI